MRKSTTIFDFFFKRKDLNSTYTHAVVNFYGFFFADLRPSNFKSYVCPYPHTRCNNIVVHSIWKGENIASHVLVPKNNNMEFPKPHLCNAVD